MNIAPQTLRILLLGDTHLGFDLPQKPRIQRRRRGHDFFNNYQIALQPAYDGDVDLVVHGGDLLFRSKVPDVLVEQSLEPLRRVADTGVPVFVVPGNHERSRIPQNLWTSHPNLYIFHQPQTFHLEIRGHRVALGGFPFARKIRDVFEERLAQTGLMESGDAVRLLCIHQSVEGAQVGPSNYTFRSGPDVIPCKMLSEGVSAVLSGHIHRAQTLSKDLLGNPLPAPVIYPGSVERTSFAERYEDKGYMLVEVHLGGDDHGKVKKITFKHLPARPMVRLLITPADLGDADLRTYLEKTLGALDPDSVVQVRMEGPAEWLDENAVSAPLLRSIAPETMNVSLAIDRSRFGRRR